MLASALSGRAANSLLTSPATGALGHSKLMAMSMASNGKDVALLLTDNKFVYAIDIADNDGKELMANAITSIPDFVNTKLKPVAGGAALTIVDMEVNPISRAVYVLATDVAGTSYVFKVRNNGATVTLMNLSSVTYSKLSISGTFSVNDMTWGNNKLYMSSGSFSLDGAVATVTAPFANGGTVSAKATSMFKSNWGGTYVTKAPLETMTYGMVKTTPRLIGVTTCAPGFSMDITKLGASGVVEVTEDFNMNMGTSRKVVFQRHDAKDWLFDLHDGKIYRIGETMLNGSQVTAGKFNNKSEMLRSMSGTPTAGMSTDIINQLTGTYSLMAYWDDYRLLLLETGGTLKLMQMATTAPPLSIEAVQHGTELMSVYPNPATHTLFVALPNDTKASMTIYNMEGKAIKTETAQGTRTAIDLSGMASGQYLLKVVSEEGKAAQQLFMVQ